VPANIFNKQSRTTDKGWSSSLRVGRGDYELLTVKNKLVTKDHKKPRTWADYFGKRPKLKKMDTRFGTKNAGSPCRAGSLMTVG
jgi:hypothetical protein